MFRFFYSPDVSVSAGGNLVEDVDAKKTKRIIPGSDDDFKVMVERISASWKNNPAITLVWVTQPEMAAEVKSFADDLALRKAAGGDRPSVTRMLQLLNTDMDGGVTEVKVYIEKKYKKVNAKPQFARFGIIKSHGAYMLPRDHNKRLLNLDLMIAAITKDGFADEEYGLQFWMDMKERFAESLSTASLTDGTVSGKVSGKNVSRTKLVKIMTALRKVLTGNYPDTYAAVFREWGWQKNDY